MLDEGEPENDTLCERLSDTDGLDRDVHQYSVQVLSEQFLVKCVGIWLFVQLASGDGQFSVIKFQSERDTGDLSDRLACSEQFGVDNIDKLHHKPSELHIQQHIKLQRQAISVIKLLELILQQRLILCWRLKLPE